MGQQKSDSLTITVSSGDSYVPVNSLIKLVYRTVKILRQIERDVSPAISGPGVTWRVSEASLNSPLKLTIFGEPTRRMTDVRRIVRVYLDGMAEMEETPSSPPHFNAKSLGLAKKISDSLENGIGTVTFSSPGKEPVSPTARASQNIAEVLAIRPAYFDEHTSIEGVIQMVALRPKLKIKIYGPQSPSGLICSFSQNSIGTVKKAIGKHAEVSGKLRSDSDGKPLFMAAKSIRVLREPNKLPRFKDLEGIDITEGVDPTEYIRRFRDGE